LATFSYEAMTREGQVVTGTMEARDERALVDRLQSMTYYPLSVSPHREAAGLSSLFTGLLGNKVVQKDIMTFTYQLSVLLDAGFPLDRSLSIVSEQTTKKPIKEIIDDLQSVVRAGKDFSEALSRHPEVFPPLFVNMVLAGEKGGFLEGTLTKLVSYIETSEKLKDDVRSALLYPIILGVVGGISVIVLLVFVVPRFTKIFADMGQALPLPTLMLLSVSGFLRDYWWALSGGLALLLLLGRLYLKSPAGRDRWDGIKFVLPLFGKLSREVAVARFSRTLGTLLQSGVSILAAFQVAEGTLGSRLMSDIVTDVRNGIKKGERVGTMLKKYKLFPSFATHMISVGEETGRLDEMLLKIADRFDVEARSTIKRLLSLLEPALILFMGLVVGFIVISVLVAIFSINDLSF
jgi:type II secretion system protein F